MKNSATDLSYDVPMDYTADNNNGGEGDDNNNGWGGMEDSDDNYKGY